MIAANDYHGVKANRQWMSVSQYKGWLECAAKQAATLRGDWIEPEKDAFTLGKYVDMALLEPDRLKAEMDANQDTYMTKAGKPRAFVSDGDAMVARAKADPIFMASLRGETQQIVTFKIGRVGIKAMLDVADPERGILTDLKTARDLDSLTWSDTAQAKVPFYEVYNYWLQMAVYRQAFKAHYGKLPKFVFIAAISKETPPVAKVYHFDNRHRFKAELDRFKANLPRILAMKSGKVEPTRCERCGYCRETFRVTEPIRAESFAPVSITMSEFEAG